MHGNSKYCSECNTSERQNSRKRKWREDEINKLKEKISDSYRYLHNKAKELYHISDEAKRNTDKIFAEWSRFKEEFDYYNDVVKKKITPDKINAQYDSSITTREKLLEWLEKRKAQLDEIKEKGG